VVDRGRRLKPARPKAGSRIKTPVVELENPQALPPLFSLADMQAGYCVSDCDREHQAGFAVALWERSKMTWLEITLAPRHGLGIEQINRTALKQPIPRKITPDVDFIALRFHGNAPMVGYRDGRIFHILWLDHDLSVYDHE
jgi:hypothetical protein